MKYKITYEDFSFVVDKTDWENAGDAICCELLTDEDMNEEDYKLICGKHTKEDTLRMYNKYKVR